MADDQDTGSAMTQELVRVSPSIQLSKAVVAPRSSDGTVSPFLRLTANLFYRPGAPRVIALVSCKSREGVSRISTSFLNFLTVHMGTRSTLLAAGECLMRSGGMSSPVGASRIGLIPSQLFLSAKEDADVLLVDCSSLESSPAAFVLAPHVDGILLVVEDGRHSAVEIQSAVKLIKNANGVILGIVLNKRRHFLPQWIYMLFSRTNR